MNARVALNLLPIALLFMSVAAHAAKVVGACTVKIEGPHAVSFTGKLYEGKPPAGAVESGASTRAWTLKNADEYRSKSSALGDQTAKMADSIVSVLSITCASDGGRVGFQPYDASAKPQDYPSGAKTYRLVGDKTRDKKSGDLQAIAMLTGEGLVILSPSENGELKVTQNDGDKLVAAFSYKSGQSTVTGTIDFSRPKVLAN